MQTTTKSARHGNWCDNLGAQQQMEIKRFWNINEIRQFLLPTAHKHFNDRINLQLNEKNERRRQEKNASICGIRWECELFSAACITFLTNYNIRCLNWWMAFFSFLLAFLVEWWDMFRSGVSFTSPSPSLIEFKSTTQENSICSLAMQSWRCSVSALLLLVSCLSLGCRQHKRKWRTIKSLHTTS